MALARRVSQAIVTRVLAAVVLTLLATPAHADLIDLGNGMIYDTLQDLTWLQDAKLSRTLGQDADGVFNYAGAVAWVADLEYAGFDDWRLPGSVRSVLSELSVLMEQLGWQSGVGNFWDVQGGYGPFLHVFDGTSLGEQQYWATPGYVMNIYFAGDIADDWVEGAGGAWAVRDGAPQRVPEPATLLTFGVGALALGRLARRRRVT